ncbi:hypothetical protein X925_06755 [Petrotoga sp. 9T1HF07.CasAA.8.2]|uniref:hypothetical protein n=1 Tax=Petrotoga sp. 9T1HF07.CasAA.8.2 TaxID=1434329 RepID=UPI000CA8725E|nr:hypothetical protein [Petrotoga sp. 9T1HF07.CasAA.8.2]PNR88365.1 hypothetical protein X925_06755 [Petrotoga sp. 9T1HF07.CasAA.8.2]
MIKATKFTSILLIFLLFVFSSFATNTSYTEFADLDNLSLVSSIPSNLNLVKLIGETEMDQEEKSTITIGVYYLASTDDHTVKIKKLNDLNYNQDYSSNFNSIASKSHNRSKSLSDKFIKSDPNVNNKNHKNDYSYKNELANKFVQKNSRLDYILSLNLFKQNTPDFIEIQQNVFIFS